MQKGDHGTLTEHYESPKLPHRCGNRNFFAYTIDPKVQLKWCTAHANSVFKRYFPKSHNFFNKHNRKKIQSYQKSFFITNDFPVAKGIIVFAHGRHSILRVINVVVCWEKSVAKRAKNHRWLCNFRHDEMHSQLCPKHYKYYNLPL